MADRERARGATRWILVLGLIGTLVMAQTAQAGGRRAGIKIGLVSISSLERSTGEVVGVRTDAIILQNEYGEARTVAIKDIKSVRIYHKSQVVVGVLVGALAGGGLGYLLSSHQNKNKFMGGIAIAGSSIGGAAAGGLLGGLTGLEIGADKTYDLTKLPPAEIDKLMAHLRKRARDPDYQ